MSRVRAFVATLLVALAACGPAAEDAQPAVNAARDVVAPQTTKARASDAATSADVSASLAAEAPKPDHALNGSVRTVDGRALPGAIVRAVPVPIFPHAPDPRAAVEATADESGAFDLRGLAAGDWALKVSAEGALGTFVATVRVPERERFDLVLPRGSEIEGTVIDETTHAPVAGARVRLYLGLAIGDATTSPDGRFSMALHRELEGSWRFLLEAEGYAHELAESSVTAIRDEVIGRHEVTLVAQRGHTLTGRVVGPDGPLAGARVEAWNHSGTDVRSTTDAAGRYAFHDLDDVDCSVRAEVTDPLGDGDAATRVVPRTILAHGKGETLWSAPDIELRRAASYRKFRLEGLIVDDEEHPVAGATVRTVQGSLSVSATTDADGRFLLEDVLGTGDAPSCFVVAEKEGYEPEGPCAWQIAERMGLTRLPHARGRVTGPDGSAVAGARVVIISSDENMIVEAPREVKQTQVSEGRTAADGSFDVMYRSLRKNLAVVVKAPGFPTWIAEMPDEKDIETPIEVALVAPRVVAGRVVRTGTDEGVGGLDVAVVRGGENVFGFEGEPFYPRVAAVTAADGAFRVEGLAPETESLRVTGSGWIAADVTAERLASKDLRVEVAPSLAIAGRLEFADGRPCSAVAVWITEILDLPETEPKSAAEREARDERIRRSVELTAAAAADGTFSFTSLPAGSYQLWLSGGSPQVVARLAGPFDAGVRDLKIELVAGRTIHGRVLGPDGKPARDVKVVARAQDRDDVASESAPSGADGAFTIGGLDDGPYEVVVKVEGCFAWTRKAVRAPCDPLEVRLDEGLAVAGVVLDADGKPKWSARLIVEPVEAADPAEPRKGETEPDGRFRITALTRGRWRIRSDPEWPFDRVEEVVVEAGSEALELRVAPPLPKPAQTPRSEDR